jgi:hypothetical protein
MRSLFICLFALSLATDAGAQSAKLTGVLADLVRASPTTTGSQTALSVDSLPPSVQDAMRARRLRLDANNEVQVYILLSAVTDDSVKQLTDAGVTIEIRDAERRRVQAHLPIAKLNAVAQLEVVDSIRLPTYARRRSGNVTTEGDTILFADAVRNQFALDGTGVRVGVISDGLKGVFATGCTGPCAGAVGGPIASGDLPLSSGNRNASGVLTSSSGGIVGRSFQANSDLEGLPPASPACAFPGAGGEGTALLEIVHDLAPGARLSFANFDTDLAFNQAVNFLAASNDIVLDDIGFFGEPYDGTSAVSSNTAAALNNPDFPIRAYFTAVGNDADEHYIGTYTASGVDGASVSGIANPGRLHLFQRSADTSDVLNLGPQPYNVIALPQNGEERRVRRVGQQLRPLSRPAEHRARRREQHRCAERPPGSGRSDRLRQPRRSGFLPHRRPERARRRPAARPEHLLVSARVRPRRTARAGAAAARSAQFQHGHAQHLGAKRA